MSADNKKPKRPRPGQNPGISVEKYNQIFMAYLEDQSTSTIAKRCGLDPRTVRKYVEEGDTTRKLRPIRERHAEIITEAQKRQDLDVSEAIANNLSLISEVKELLMTKCREQITPDGVLTATAFAELPADPTPSMERLIRLEMTLHGQPDLTIETTNLFSGWTRDEIVAYASTGKHPSNKKGGTKP